MYFIPASLSIFLTIIIAIVTAGLMWPPEIFIVAVTTTANTTPCAKATVVRSPPIIIEPAPMNVKAKVPINSQINLLSILTSVSLIIIVKPFGEVIHISINI